MKKEMKEVRILATINLIKAGNKNIGKRYSIKLKLDVIDYVKAFGRNQAAIKFVVSQSTVSNWIMKENDYNEIPNKDKRKSLHPRSKRKYPVNEEKLTNFIEFIRKLLNPITTWLIINEIYKMHPSFKKKKYKTIMCGYINSFKKSLLFQKTNTCRASTFPRIF